MNKFNYILLIFVFTLSINSVQAHKRAKYNIVIDSDGSIEDFRAISLFCASLEFNINGITSVNGSLEANKTVNFLNKLLINYHHEGIPLGEGENKKLVKDEKGKQLNLLETIFSITNLKFTNAADLLGCSISNERKRTIIIALGPLTNIAEMLKKYPDNIIKTEMILWYCDFENLDKDFNFKQDKKAFGEIKDMQVPIKYVYANNFSFSNDFTEFITEINSNYAKMFKTFVELEKNVKIGKELTALYLLYPSIFDEKIVGDFAANLKLQKNSEPEILISSVLNSDKPQASVVFNEIPTSGYMIMKDVDKYSAKLIEKHGYNEFKITALCSEIHSHIGIYNILGAKVGLRILEYLHAGLDEIKLISYAGFQPPISCFNDGLQVGTGSTIGYGTISVDTSKGILPEVLVIYNKRNILFKIKPEIIEMAAEDIRVLVQKHGLESEMYWNVLREISIEKYWLNISRYDLVEIVEL